MRPRDEPFATEKLPQPHEAICVVSNDLASRTLTVRLSDLANGYTRLLWKEAFRALRRSEEVGMRDSHPTVWASTPQAYQVAHATAGNTDFGGMLKFVFPPSEQAYTKLISKRDCMRLFGLTARPTVS
jgi:hypothetical protein